MINADGSTKNMRGGWQKDKQTKKSPNTENRPFRKVFVEKMKLLAILFSKRERILD